MASAPRSLDRSDAERDDGADPARRHAGE
jgi:hypothetical protein